VNGIRDAADTTNMIVEDCCEDCSCVPLWILHSCNLTFEACLCDPLVPRKVRLRKPFGFTLRCSLKVEGRALEIIKNIYTFSGKFKGCPAALMQNFRVLCSIPECTKIQQGQSCKGSGLT